MIGWQVDRQTAIREPDNHCAKLLAVMGELKRDGKNAFRERTDGALRARARLSTAIEDLYYGQDDAEGAWRFERLKTGILLYFAQTDDHADYIAQHQPPEEAATGQNDALKELDELERQADQILRTLALGQFSNDLHDIFLLSAAGELNHETPLHRLVAEQTDLPHVIRMALMTPAEQRDIAQRDAIAHVEQLLRTAHEEREAAANVIAALQDASRTLSDEISRLGGAIQTATKKERVRLERHTRQARLAWVDTQKQIASLTERLADRNNWHEENLPVLREKLNVLCAERPDLAASREFDRVNGLRRAM
ncbi:hypothetical protein [Yoonia sediminilitoris]|nr:hypothetical protein [Yoonia sediminilitoris]